MNTASVMNSRRQYGSSNAPAGRALEKWSFGFLLLYFAAQPFNFVLNEIPLIGSLVNLLWGAVLCLLVAVYAFKRKRIITGTPLELKIVLLWTAYVICSYLGTMALVATRHKDFVYDVNDALRNLLQTAPLFVLITIRGLREKEFHAYLAALVLMTPLSIVAAYQVHEVSSFSEAQDYIGTGRGIAYNTFVPYTTFPLFASVYLMVALKSRLLKLCVACVGVGILVFIFTNPSRQSVLFVLFGTVMLLFFTRSLKLLTLLAFFVVVLVISLTELDATDFVSGRFFSEGTLQSERTLLMQAGLSSINGVTEWVFGKGLHVVLSDINPHNNFIFTVIRMGLIGAILLFAPFFLALASVCVRTFNVHSHQRLNRPQLAFLVISLSFTLFHSFFGYPHIDPVNAPVVWFGLSAAVGLRPLSEYRKNPTVAQAQPRDSVLRRATRTGRGKRS